MNVSTVQFYEKNTAGLGRGDDTMHSVRVSASKEVTFEQRSERSEGTSHSNFSYKDVPNRRNDTCKEPEIGI